MFTCGLFNEFNVEALLERDPDSEFEGLSVFLSITQRFTVIYCSQGGTDKRG